MLRRVCQYRYKRTDIYAGIYSIDIGALRAKSAYRVDLTPCIASAPQIDILYIKHNGTRMALTFG